MFFFSIHFRCLRIHYCKYFQIHSIDLGLVRARKKELYIYCKYRIFHDTFTSYRAIQFEPNIVQITVTPSQTKIALYLPHYLSVMILYGQCTKNVGWFDIHNVYLTPYFPTFGCHSSDHIVKKIVGCQYGLLHVFKMCHKLIGRFIIYCT